jgi:circadian clock protein KaiC
LQTRTRGRRSERDLVVHKMRGSGFLRGTHSFEVGDGGIVVQPRIEAILSEPSRPIEFDGPVLSTGVKRFDEILGGGPLRRSTSLIMGAAGTGKSTAGLHFLGAGDDERGIYLSFNESPPAIRRKAKALDLPVARLFDEGIVEIMWRPATEGVFDEVFGALVERVRDGRLQRVFIDGITDFVKVTDEESRMVQALTALTNEFRALGATTLVSMELDFNGVVPGQPLAGLPVVGLSPVAENIVLLRLAALGSDVHRLIIALKARDNAFQPKFRRYDIGKNGLEIEADSSQAEIVLSELVRPTGTLPAPFGSIAAGPSGDDA